MKNNHTEKFQHNSGININDVVDLCNMLILEQDKGPGCEHPSPFKSTWLVAEVLNQINPEYYARVAVTGSIALSPKIYQAFRDHSQIWLIDKFLHMHTFGGAEFVTEYCQHELKNHFLGRHVCVVLDTLCDTQMLIDPAPHNMASPKYGIVPDTPMAIYFDSSDNEVGIESHNGSVIFYLVCDEYTISPELTDEVQEKLMDLVPRVLSELSRAESRKKADSHRDSREVYTLVEGKCVDPIILSNMIKAVMGLN